MGCAELSQAPVKWESVDVTPILKDGRTTIPDEAIESVKRNYVALKGPLAVRIMFSSIHALLANQYPPCPDSDW